MDKKQLECMRYAGFVNRKAIQAGFDIARSGGITLANINKHIEKAILTGGCRPAFKGYKPPWTDFPFPSSACTSVNDVAVHGIPSEYVLKKGDLLTIDVGTEYKGWFADSANTRIIGEINYEESPSEAQALLQANREILAAQTSILREGCSLLEIMRAAEHEAKKHSVTILHQFSGHFIGNKIHMEPSIPNAIDPSLPIGYRLAEIKRLSDIKLKAGDTICIEPVTTFGSSDIIIDDDKWTVRQAQGRIVSHLEHCVLILENGFEIL